VTLFLEGMGMLDVNLERQHAYDRLGHGLIMTAVYRGSTFDY
jgi:hypothetical protein